MRAELILENVSLNYKLYDAENRSLKKTILKSMVGGRIDNSNKGFTEILSLSKINLNLRKGSRLALLGHNGAGKTTLLRCMGGIYAPTFGKIIRKGKFEVLIDPYAGINHEASGRHNIYNLAYARGYSKSFIQKIENRVIEFSELGEFIDMPIRSFSMGMISRLAFSVISHLEADVLLIDEGIGAGDKSFQEKSARQFRHFLDRTQILVLATHSIDLAKMYCDSYVCLENGKIVEKGKF